MYVIQSATTGAFLAPSGNGEPEWVMLLSEAGAVDGLDDCAQLIDDHAEPWHRAQVVDLSALGRPARY